MPWSCAGHFYEVSLFVDVVYINENFSKNWSETVDNKTMALTLCIPTFDSWDMVRIEWRLYVEHKRIFTRI